MILVSGKFNVFFLFVSAKIRYIIFAIANYFEMYK